MSVLTDMGLAPLRCNGCERNKLKFKLGDKYLELPEGIYEFDANPVEGQGKPLEYGGHPIRFHFWGMSYEHSDECYHWSLPKEKK